MLGVTLSTLILKERYFTPPVAPQAFVCRTIRIPDDQNLVAAVNEVLAILTNPEVFKQADGGLTPEQTCFLTATMWEEYAESDACMLGAVFPYTTVDPPPNCIPCDGSTFNREDYPRLYANLDPVFIEDEDHFFTPSLTDKFLVGAGGTYSVHEAGGANTVTLLNHNLPAHQHILPSHTHPYDGPAADVLIVQGELVPVTVGGTKTLRNTSIQQYEETLPVGGNVAHENRPPYVALKYCMVAR